MGAQFVRERDAGQDAVLVGYGELDRVGGNSGAGRETVMHPGRL